MPIILWFDDSLLNTYQIVWPLLEDYGYKGTISVITGYIGNIWHEENQRSKRLMSIEQMKEMHTAGWDFQSHGVTHTKFTELSTEQAIFELIKSKQWMQTNLNITPCCFSLPHSKIAHINLILKHYDYVRIGAHYFWDGCERKIPIINNIEEAIKISKYSYLFANIIFHSVISKPENWEHTYDDFKYIIDKIHNSDVDVVTFKDSINNIKKRESTPFYINKFIIRNYFKIYFLYKNARAHMRNA